jgi:Mn-dependent DtxR family transcriptional regulator
MDQGLTFTERRVYDAAVALMGEKSYPPSFAEVARKAEVSECTAHKSIWRLVQLGALNFDPRSKRSLTKGTPLSKLKKKKRSA